MGVGGLREKRTDRTDIVKNIVAGWGGREKFKN